MVNNQLRSRRDQERRRRGRTLNKNTCVGWWSENYNKEIAETYESAKKIFLYHLSHIDKSKTYT